MRRNNIEYKFLLFILLMWTMVVIGTLANKPYVFKNVVSYEYTKTCNCGGTIEGYHSIANNFTTEECKTCGEYYEKSN